MLIVFNLTELYLRGEKKSGIRTLGLSKSVGGGGGTNPLLTPTFESSGAQAPAAPFSYALEVKDVFGRPRKLDYYPVTTELKYH